MNARHTYLICRAAVFAMLLATAGITSISVAGDAQDARQMKLAGAANGTDFAQAQTATATVGNGPSF